MKASTHQRKRDEIGKFPNCVKTLSFADDGRRDETFLWCVHHGWRGGREKTEKRKMKNDGSFCDAFVSFDRFLRCFASLSRENTMGWNFEAGGDRKLGHLKQT